MHDLFETSSNSVHHPNPQVAIANLEMTSNCLENGRQKNNVENLIVLAQTSLDKGMSNAQQVALISVLNKTKEFLNGDGDDDALEEYDAAILEAARDLDSFPWFNVMVGILLSIIALALLLTAAALVTSLIVTTGPVAAIVAPVVVLFEKVIAFTAGLSIAELTFGAVVAGTVGTTAATGAVAGINTLGAVVSGCFATFFLNNSTFKGCMENIRKERSLGEVINTVDNDSNSNISGNNIPTGSGSGSGSDNDKSSSYSSYTM